MSMAMLSKNLDSDLYKEAVSWRDPETNVRTTPLRYLGEKVREADTYKSRGLEIPPALQYFAHTARDEHGVYPEGDELKELESYWLRRLKVQPWEEDRGYKVRQFAADYGCLEKVFLDKGMVLRGPHADIVAKAFSLSTLQVIFPIFYDSAIMAGILAMPILDILVMDTVQVASGVADHAVMNETATDRQFGETGEWATFAEVNISATNAPIKLKKFGGILNASDEAVRRARIPVFARGVERVGRQLGIDLTDFAIDVLLNGDGTASGGAAISVAATTAGSPTYNDYLSLFFAFPIGYEPSDIIMGKPGLQQMLRVPEFKDPLAGFKFQNQGVLPEPLGLMSHRWDSTGSTTWSNSAALNLALVVQRNRALIAYQEGGLNTESDRIVNGEITRVKSSLYFGLGIWDSSARVQGTGFA